MKTNPPGKHHRNRLPRGSLRARLWRENPFQFALLYHDFALAQAMRQRAIEEAAMWKATDACCVECHALMIHAASGIFYCPYERAAMHDRARRIFAAQKPDSSGLDILRRTNEANHLRRVG